MGSGEPQEGCLINMNKILLVLLIISLQACTHTRKYCGTTISYCGVPETKESLGCISECSEPHTVDSLTAQPK